MRPFSQLCRSCVALCGLIAVLLGALEHEALILQPDRMPAAVAAADALMTPEGDNGTEGTFRAEKRPPVLSHAGPARSVAPSLPAWTRAGPCRSTIRVGAAPPRLVGVVVLRV